MNWNYIIAFLLSMAPIVELRGGMIFAAARGIPFWHAVVICLIGNILPIPFILLFIRGILRFLERFTYTRRIVRAVERRARSKQEKVIKYQMLGLFILVAIPLPGTGAWTGALIAALMDIQIRRSFPVIALGVIAACVIMSLASYWLPGVFFPVP